MSLWQKGWQSVADGQQEEHALMRKWGRKTGHSGGTAYSRHMHWLYCWGLVWLSSPP